MHGICQDLGLAGRSLVVTGGASGIGRSAALLLVAAGARVTIGDIDEAGMAETTALAADLPGAIAAVPTDVSVESDLERLVATAVAAHGSLDGAANVAGYPPCQKLLTQTAWADWRRCVEVNLGGVFFEMKYQIAGMLAGGKGGAIVNVASNTAIAGYTHMSDYTSAKSGVVGLARTAVQEFGLKGVRVNTVLPGPVETPMLRTLLENAPEVGGGMVAAGPPGRIAHPDEVGLAVRWLPSGEASFVNGACLTVDGGMTTG